MDEDLALFGLYLETPIEIEYRDVWPENWTAAQVFIRLAMQWQIGPTGKAVCLNFPAVEVVMNAMQIPAEERRGILDQICVMEDAGASWLNKR